MISTAMAVFNFVVGAAIAVGLFWSYSDRTIWSGLYLAVFYTVGVVVPFRWTRRMKQQLDLLPVPITKELRMAAYYPMMIGIAMMMLAIGLIREARLQ